MRLVVDFKVTGTSVPDDRLESNIAHARSLGLPSAERRAGGGVLNVIGRGPSVAGHAEFLRQDVGDNWAAGTAWGWCRDNGIPAVAVFADPSPIMAEPRYTLGVTRAVVSEQCDPALFAALRGAEVSLMSLDQWAVGYSAAVTALVLGFNPETSARLYGCEGSFGECTHADEAQPQPNLITVRCNGEQFQTNPQMIMQCEEFVRIRQLCKPGVTLFENRSGGLLDAMLATGGEWELLRWDNAPANVRELMERAA